jgi:hypothetical protein
MGEQGNRETFGRKESEEQGVIMNKDRKHRPESKYVDAGRKVKMEPYDRGYSRREEREEAENYLYQIDNSEKEGED